MQYGIIELQKWVGGLIICGMSNNGCCDNSVIEAASIERCFNLYRRHVREMLTNVVLPRCYYIFEPNIFYESGGPQGMYARLLDLHSFVEALVIREARIRFEFKLKLGPWVGRYGIMLMPHEHPSEYYLEVTREIYPNMGLGEAGVDASSGFNLDQALVFRHIGHHLNYFDQKVNEMDRFISMHVSYPNVSYGFLMHPVVCVDEGVHLMMFIQQNIIDNLVSFNSHGIPERCYNFGSGTQCDVAMELRQELLKPKKWIELRDNDRCHRYVLRTGVAACMPSDDDDSDDDF